ncbi:hypothetical protein L227DRAFT_574458 [Lentinus tigrinus ALCF2SS1-6]|uniref:Uncharacterized protein n=1 Tax=Lentinus tigrinus ALCF2SS1-6 TaxID=1328759 RepID=A0A5C2SDR9_9APHY|nr:hypothetical protein L227DRAFT_574458 [Lentinus tigrinus ALCF2SS1-6]
MRQHDGYLPIKEGEEADPETRPDIESGGTRLAWCAYALLAVNVLFLLFAFRQLEGIHSRLEAVLDVVDTRALPRPDPLFSLAL